MNSYTSHLFLAAAAVAALTTSPLVHAAEAERHEHKDLPAASGGTLTFKAFVGAIDIKTQAKDEVTYDAVLKPGGWRSARARELMDLVEFDYQTSDGDVQITMKWKDDKARRNTGLNVRHTLWVPAKYNVDVETAGGGITAEDLNGQVAAHTSGGSIRLGRVNGNVKARTSGGGITLGDVQGNADLNTSGGRIKVGAADGDVAARTSGGGITVGDVQGNADLETSGGNIEVGAVAGHLEGRTSGGTIGAELTRQIEKPIELRTSGGNIRLTLPKDFKADLDARTSGGRVECELPLQGTVKRNLINGKINGGGPKVTLRTSGGSIKVIKH